MPSNSPFQNAAGAGRSAVAVHVASRQWIRFLSRLGAMAIQMLFFMFLLTLNFGCASHVSRDVKLTPLPQRQCSFPGLYPSYDNSPAKSLR